MLKRTTIGEAFQVNPKVRIKKGQVVPFVSMDQIIPGQGRVSASEIRTFKGGSKFQPEDTLMARITPCLENGKISRYISVDVDQPAAGSTEFIVLRGKEGYSTTPFAYYFATSPDIRELSISLMTGTSGRQRVDVNAFKDSEVLLPPLAVQRDIASVLGALDDKIAANSRSVVSAEKLAISIAEKCEAMVPVAEIATRVATSLNPKKIELQEVMHYSIPAFDQGYVSVELSDSIKSSKFKLDRPCVLVSKLNPQTPRVWSVPIIEKDVYSLASTEFIVLEPVGCNLGQLFAAVSQGSLFVELQSQASGTSNSHQRVKPDDLLSALVPDVRSLSSDEVSLLDGLNLLAYKLKRENQTLAKTRDELLPLLMSGKITVREAEEAAAEVGVETREEEGNV